MAFVDFGYDMVTGTFRLDANGDLDVDAGVSLRRKLIYRRVLSTPGAFYHLPNYGVGVQEKGLTDQSSLYRLENRIREQLEREDSIRVELVRVRQLTMGVYLIEVQASFQSENKVILELRVSNNSEQFEVSFS